MPLQPDDARRYDALFDEHRRSVLAFALRRTDDAADAADVVAETFLIAWRRLDQVPRGEDARPWLLAVARRVLANQRRGTRRRLELADRLGRQLAASLPSPVPPSEDEQMVRSALDRLSDDDREVLLLSGWEGLSPGEIAVVLGLRSVTVRSRLHRARRRLRAELETLGWDGFSCHPEARSPIDLAQEHTA